MPPKLSFLKEYLFVLLGLRVAQGNSSTLDYSECMVSTINLAESGLVALLHVFILG